MNICLMNDSFPPVIDGVANAVLNYAENLQQNHGSVIVAVPEYPGFTDNYPFSVVRYPSVNTTALVGYRAGLPFSHRSLNRLESFEPDIIHSHCPVTATLMARVLRERVNAPLIMTYHTKYDIDIAKAIRGKHLQAQAIRALADNISACDEVWVVSKGAGENLKSLGFKGDYVLMENGVDFPRGRVSDEDVAAVSRLHHLSCDDPVFLFVGRMMWYKGIRLILDGLKQIQAQGHRFTMIFIGDGADRKAIEQYTEKLGLTDRCIFTGAIRDRERLRAYFCRSDLFLFPSTFDTNGIVVREAAACGLASLLIRGSCAAEGVTDGQNGFLVSETAQSVGNFLGHACRMRDTLKTVGLRAMDELYLSWADSVERAYQRYELVRERYERSGSRCARGLTDELFTLINDVGERINTVRDLGEEIKQNILDTLDHYL